MDASRRSGSEGGRLGAVRVVAREALSGPSVAVAVADGGDAAVAWSTRAARSPNPARTAAFAAVRRGSTGFGAARRLATAEFDFVRAAAAGPAGRLVVVWMRPDVDTGRGRVRAVTAAPRARRFGRPYDVSPVSGALVRRVALAGTPRGFVAV
jgi:hypothetical protein